MSDSETITYLYELPPIDYWAGWSTFEHYEHIETEETSMWRTDGDIDGGNWLMGMLNEAKIVAKFCGWEGDGIWRVAPLPCPNECMNTPMFCVKQQNNGTVFLYIPFELPWLHDCGGRLFSIQINKSGHPKVLQQVWL